MAKPKQDPTAVPDSGGMTTMERIVMCASDVFAERGFSESTIAQISEAAGVSRALLFFYFGSKEGILDAVAEHARVEIGQVFDHANGLKGLEALRSFFAAREDFFNKRPQIARLVMVLGSEAITTQRGNVPFVEFQDRRIKLFTRCITEAIEDGTLQRDVHVTQLAHLFAAATDGDVRMWSIDPAGRPIEATHKAILDVFRLLAPKRR